jgi:hypothetical protein
MSSPAPGDGAGPVVPRYGRDTLSAVLPGAAAALGVDLGMDFLPLPECRGVCVVLVDGLGARMLAEVAADGAHDAPFLTALLGAEPPAGCPAELRVGCPTTTATSMGSFGTGLSPGRHGLLGYEVLDPDRGVLLNELRWDPYTDPLIWQPFSTVFGRCAAAGIAVTRIGDPEFDGSGLTVAAHRGGEFVGRTSVADRVDVAVDALARSGPALVYLYWGKVDAAGHQHGWRSAAWRGALREIDAALADLARRIPAGTRLVITADHGMVDVPHSQRLDLTDAPSLRDGIAVLGGEARFVQLYCRPGHADAVAARMRDALGDRAWVRTRDEAIAQGWFGPVEARVLPRIGEVLIAARGTFAIVDRMVTRRHVLALIGQHGSLTDAEQLVPLLTVAR